MPTRSCKLVHVNVGTTWSEIILSKGIQCELSIMVLIFDGRMERRLSSTYVATYHQAQTDITA